MREITIEIPEKKYKVANPWERLIIHVQETGLRVNSSSRARLIRVGHLYLNENKEPVYGYMCEVED